MVRRGKTGFWPWGRWQGTCLGLLLLLGAVGGGGIHSWREQLKSSAQRGPPQRSLKGNGAEARQKRVHRAMPGTDTDPEQEQQRPGH